MDTGKKQRRMPRGFEEFVNSDLCAEFAESIFDYCMYLIKVEDKKRQLEEDARIKRIPAPVMLQSEHDRLSQLAKRMADNYGRLIFLNRSIGQQLGQDDDPAAHCNDRLQFKTKIYLNKDNDNGFFNAVVKLFARALRNVVKELEEKEKGGEYMERVEVEIDRLFKTNVFNQAARNQERKKMLIKHPELRNFEEKELQMKKIDKVIEKLQKRA